MVDPEQPAHLRDWFLETGGLERDPEAAAGDGSLFIRRSVFGDYVGAQLDAAAADNPAGCTLTHRRDRALDIIRESDGYRVNLQHGDPLVAAMVVVAASYEQPAVPGPFTGALAGHSAFLADPWDNARLAAIRPDARVLVLGLAQTGSEVVAGLLRRGHAGPITALSRGGRRPIPRPAGAAPPDSSLFDRVNRETSLHTSQHGRLTSVTDILHRMRADVRAAEAAGGTWAEPFGILRDSMWQVWPALPLAEKRRFMRHLRRWYDAHRFQLPPQVEDRLAAGEARGQVIFRAGSIATAEARDGTIIVSIRARGSTDAVTAEFDAIINSTGPAPNPARSANPLLRAVVDSGLAAPHGTGVGFAVDEQNRAINADGASEPGLFVVGPLTYGAYADQQSAAFIATRIRKIMPAFVQSLRAPADERLRDWQDPEVPGPEVPRKADDQ